MFYAGLIGAFLFLEGIFNFSVWMWSSIHIPGYTLSNSEAWLKGMGPIMVGGFILLAVAYTCHKRREACTSRLPQLKEIRTAWTASKPFFPTI
jgi:hypothetical protein